MCILAIKKVHCSVSGTTIFNIELLHLSNAQVHEEEAGHPSAHSGLRYLVGFDLMLCTDDLPARFGAWRADQRSDRA